MLKKLMVWFIAIAIVFTSMQVNQSAVRAAPTVTHKIVASGTSFTIKNAEDEVLSSGLTSLQAAVDFVPAGSTIQFGDGTSTITMPKGIPLIATNNNVTFTGKLTISVFTIDKDGSFQIPNGVTAIFDDLIFTNTTVPVWSDAANQNKMQGTIIVQEGGTLNIQGSNTKITHLTAGAALIYNNGKVNMSAGLLESEGTTIFNKTPNGTSSSLPGVEITGGKVSSNSYAIYIANSNKYTAVSIKNAVIESRNATNGYPAILVNGDAQPTITIFDTAQIQTGRIGNVAGTIAMNLPTVTADTYGSITFKNDASAGITIHHTYHARTLVKGMTKNTTFDSLITGASTDPNGIGNATLKVDQIIKCEGSTTYSESFLNWSNGSNTTQVNTTNPATVGTILGSLPASSSDIYPNFYCPAKSADLTFSAKNGTTPIELATDISSTASAIKLTATVPNDMTTFDLSFLKQSNGIIVKDSKNVVKTSPMNALPLNPGVNTFTYTATSQDGTVTKTYTIEITREAPTVAAPIIAPSTADITSGSNITLTSPTDGATMYYTTDGSDPATSPTRKAYSGPFPITGTGTVKAYATKEGMAPSTVATQTYTVTPENKLPEPVITVPVPIINVVKNTEVTITIPEGADVYYTLDGSDPSTSPTRIKYTGTFPVTGSGTVKAYATKDGKFDSTIASAPYTNAKNTLSSPSISPNSGVITGETDITLTATSSDVAGAEIWYTTDGSDPRVLTNPNRQKYNGTPFKLTESGTVKAYTSAPSLFDSPLVTETYTILPIISEKVGSPIITPSTAEIASGSDITLESTTDGATMYYTTDGSDPATSPTRKTYSGPFPMTGTGTVKAYAIKDGMAPSTVATQTYTVTPENKLPEPVITVPVPIINVVKNTEVTITIPEGADVYYTLDGSDPSTSPTRIKYTGTFPVTGSGEVKAYATKDGKFDSTIASAPYSNDKNTLSKPEISPEVTEITSDTLITLKAATPDAETYYTTDGSDPRTSSTRIKYTKPFPITEKGIVKAYSTAANMFDSPVETKTYTIINQEQPSTSRPRPRPIPQPTISDIKGKAVDLETTNEIKQFDGKVTNEVNGTKTVVVKDMDATLLTYRLGKNLNDNSNVEYAPKLGFNLQSSAAGSPAISMNAAGDLSVSNLTNGSEYTYDVTYDLGDGQKIVIGKVYVSVSATGEVNLNSSLIDPYGTITDALTGQPISGANVVLMYADTQRNRDAGRTPDTMVSLPVLSDFPPNNNMNPQISSPLGGYAYMVYPHTDYYLVATKDGYLPYRSTTIAVETDLVKWDFTMMKSAIVLATKTLSFDRLAGETLAAQHGTVVRTVGNTKTEINKLLAYLQANVSKQATVYILGGTKAVHQVVETAIRQAGYTDIKRVFGPTLYDTANAIAKYMEKKVERPVILTSGEKAFTIMPQVVKLNSNIPTNTNVVNTPRTANNYPIIYTRKNTLHWQAKDALVYLKPSKIYVVGNEKTISQSQVDSIVKMLGLTSSDVVWIKTTTDINSIK